MEKIYYKKKLESKKNFNKKITIVTHILNERNTYYKKIVTHIYLILVYKKSIIKD